MTCDAATFALERRRDGTLGADEARALEGHLRACAACRAEAAAISLADAAFMRLPEVEPPRDLAAAVAAQIAREAPAEPGRGWVWGAFAVLAAVCAALYWAGVTPAFLWNLPLVAAVFGPVVDGVSDWLRPVTLALQPLTPVAGAALAWAAALAVAGTGLLGLWAARWNSRRLAGYGG